MATQSDEWNRRIGLAFDSRPRVAVEPGRRWIDRTEERKLRAAVVCPGVHVCLYGPSGSGKTSLARTVMARLQRHGAKYVYVRINHSMGWTQFKSQIMENKQTKGELDEATGVKLGISNLLPYIEFTGAVSEGGLRTAAGRAGIIESLTLMHIAQVLIDSGLVLVLDDLNFASSELLRMLTDLAKEITDHSISNSSAKVVFVGADDIFLSIIKAEPSLKDRMDEVALGSIEDGD